MKMDEKQLLIDKTRNRLNGINEIEHQSSRQEWAEASWLRWGHLLLFFMGNSSSQIRLQTNIDY